MKAIISNNFVLAAALVTFSVSDIDAASFGTAFTYQGRLTEGTNKANGNYDLIFSLYESDTSTSSLTSPLTNSAVAVSNGLFKTKLDFGASILNGTNAWLEISVRTNGSGLFTTLSPRQNLTPAPYSIRAEYADALNGVLPTGALAGSYTNALAFNNAGNSFTGYGAGLTNVNADTFGTLPASAFWQLGGNAGTTPGTDFLGTTDDQPLELWVNGQRALRLEPTTNSPNVIGGSASNYVTNAVGVTIGGGSGNAVARSTLMADSLADYATIGGGSENSVDGGSYGTIAGGSNNCILDYVGSTCSVISGGAGNSVADGQYATIAGGSGNEAWVAGDCTTISGGGGNSISSAFYPGFSMYATIGGGATNLITEAPQSTIAGGGGNSILGNDLLGWVWDAFIGGGTGNSIYCQSYGAMIGGGTSNSIEIISPWSTIAGGSDNSIGIYGAGATIAGGALNRVDRGADYYSYRYSYGTIGGGQSNSVSRPYGIVPGGLQAAARNYGQMAHASGQFATAGDAQTSVYVCRGTTTNATLSELFLDGVSERMVVPTNSTWGFDVLVTGRASNGNSAAYSIKGTIKNTGGTTTSVGSPVFQRLGNDDATWDVVVGVDSVDQALSVKVKGASSTFVRWVASVRTVEVTY
jgi:hypothetical protein